MLFTFTAVRQVYQANHQGCSFGGPINTHGELDVYIMWHLQRAWSCLRRYSMEIYDTPGVLLRLRVIMIKAEPIESYYTDAYYGVRTRLFTPAHGRLTTPCSSNALTAETKARLSHPILLRCLYADTDAGSIEATVHTRRVLFTGVVVRKGKELLPRRVCFGELVGGNGYSGGQEKNCMKI